jgi:formate hydrogenlyase subunit 4
MIDTIVHIAVLFALPPLLLGVINKTKALFAGRRGASLLQPYYDMVKLFRKGFVLSGTTTWVFRAGPVVTLVAVALAGLLVPFGPFPAPLGFEGDVILFAYLLSLARFFTTSAALDTGSAFEGMGASREVTFAFLSEPALFLAFLMLGMESQSVSLSEMLRAPEANWSASIAAPLILVALGLFMVLLAETCRIPVDDPNTHLELTMIHEAMVLDHGGPFLGAISYSASMKLLILGSILLHVICPFSAGKGAADWLLFSAELLVLSIIIGSVESLMARLRMNRVPYFLAGALLCCGGGLILFAR